MKQIQTVTLSVLFGAGLVMAASNFAAAQVGGLAQPGRPGGVAAPRPPAIGRTPSPVHPGGIAPRPRINVPRGPVVIHPKSPLKRPPRAVVVRPPRGSIRVRIEPRLFLPSIVFGGVVIGDRYDRRYRDGRGYSRDSLVWQDSETLYREDDWTEFTLDCNARGTKLWFEVQEGRLQVDWAEVVFESGEVQVVEFPDRSMGRGIYQLLDFRDGRRVDYVRMVAMASSSEARLTLWLER
jgi:hypothetical protein